MYPRTRGITLISYLGFILAEINLPKFRVWGDSRHLAVDDAPFVNRENAAWLKEGIQPVQH